MGTGILASTSVCSSAHHNRQRVVFSRTYQSPRFIPLFQSSSSPLTLQLSDVRQQPGNLCLKFGRIEVLYRLLEVPDLAVLEQSLLFLVVVHIAEDLVLVESQTFANGAWSRLLGISGGPLPNGLPRELLKQLGLARILFSSAMAGDSAVVVVLA